MVEYVVSSDTAIETVGFTLAGMLHDIVFVFEPIDESPEYVVIVNVTLTLAPDGD